MKCSKIALKILAARECGIIKSNAHFWNNFENKVEFERQLLKNNVVLETVETILNELKMAENEIKIICIFDEDFPIINSKVKNKGDKPYLLFYKGELSLLRNLNNNVAVIGLTNPEEEIIKREEIVVRDLVKENLVIVSGLALGCDTIAHRTCLESGGKTIAILPSQINKITPLKNRELANEIINNGGLLISEYYKEANSKYEAIGRFIERDRLQAMFSKAIILMASYRKGEGDSGSRHAMEAARKYEIERYVMYNENTDKNDIQFGLNKELANNINDKKAKILQANSIYQIKKLRNLDLTKKTNLTIGDQLTML